MAVVKRLKLEAVILCFINLINYIDRFTVSGLLFHIKKEFHMDHEWQGGLLQTAFIICYFASAPIFGYLGDRYSRKYLMVFGIIAWTGCTLAASFMPNYISFVITRAAVGFGEAGFTIIAPTLIGDMFIDRQLTMVLALFYLAIPVGSGLGYMVGSQVANIVGDWRWGVRCTPIVTVVSLILLIMFLEDRPRGQLAKLKVSLEGQSKKQMFLSYVEDLVYLCVNKSYILSTFAATSLMFCTGALTWWAPHFIEYALQIRNDSSIASESDPKIEDASFIFGVVMVLAGVCGLSLGSGLSYWLRPKFKWVDPVICGVGLLASSPILFLSIYICKDHIVAYIVLIFFGQVFVNMNWAIIVDMSLYVVVPTKRSSGEAFQLMLSHAIGEAGSPYLIGFITDQFIAGYSGFNATYDETIEMTSVEKNYLSYQKSLSITIAFEVLAGILFLMAGPFVVKDWEKAEEEEQNPKSSVQSLLPQRLPMTKTSINNLHKYT